MRHAPRITIVLTAVAAVAAAVSAGAQPVPPVYDRIDLGATAEREVENDLLIAVVYAEVENSDQARAADEVNAAIRWASDQTRTASGIAMQTQQYTTRPVYANDRRIVGWVARQSLRLESADAEALSTLLGELQSRVAIESLRSSLSSAARVSTEETLIAEALAAYRRRAELVATELGRDGYRIVHLNVGSSGPIAFREARAQGLMSAADSPAIEAGVQTVTVSVNGTIELEPAR